MKKVGARMQDFCKRCVIIVKARMRHAADYNDNIWK